MHVVYDVLQMLDDLALLGYFVFFNIKLSAEKIMFPFDSIQSTF